MPVPRFQQFFEDHRDVVYRYLLVRVGRLEVDDCFQETFLSALRAYPRLREDSNVTAWVLKIAERKAVDSWRASERRPSPQAELPDVPTGDPPEIDPRLWSAVRRLPPKQSAAIANRFAADLPYGDVAAAMDTSEAAARQNVRQGLKNLRRMLGE